jgi:hypothetical protein
MQMSVNFYDRYQRAEHEAKTIGIVLCSEKNDAMAKITTMKAAENAGCAEETHKRIHDLVARESFGERFVTKVLGRQLGLS